MLWYQQATRLTERYSQQVAIPQSKGDDQVELADGLLGCIQVITWFGFLFDGRSDILSIYFAFTVFLFNTPSSAIAFTISLAGLSGQIVGDSVASSLLVAGIVYIPAEEELQSSVSGNASHSPSGSGVGGGEGNHSHPAPAESCGMSLYGCHLPSDVIWAPTARQQPPSQHF
ncbi:hypothetical protein NE237_006967 [Protea cynaroides]|uniref:Uncharacterized protein n=1 Tax=Protea cynaroides TaxID=273540 RepID=A0A9Q0KNF5_9MAGN|nr:hypothetical protein NE237_006967 [Protea cynaroides]